MTTFLSFQATYHAIEIGLHKDNNLIAQMHEEKTRASKNFFCIIQDLLSTHKVLLSDISFFAVNLGPGPFTTLRVVIASVNGISFATNIPMMGVDGFDAFLDEYRNPQFSYTVILLNAFNKDVYFAYEDIKKGVIEKGCDNFTALVNRLLKEFPADATIQFLGNGTEMYHAEIKDLFGSRAIIQFPIIQMPSIAAIGLQGLKKWQHQESPSYQLLPLYLKPPQLFLTAP